MSVNADPFEEGEIEDAFESTSNCDGGIDETIGKEARDEKLPERVRSADCRERESSNEVSITIKADLTDDAEMSEYEMLYVRGASPPPCSTYNSFRHFQDNQSDEVSDDRYQGSDASSSRERRSRWDRTEARYKGHSTFKKARLERKYQSGNNEELTSDENITPRMEICKFYLLGCCSKRIECTYMHSDFPCKFFHLGIGCENEKGCKFSHGKALSAEISHGLARHIATAPKHILGSFKRYSYDKAMSLIEKTNRELNSGHDEKIFDGKESLSPDKRSSSKTKSPPRLDSTTSQQWANDAISLILSGSQKEKITALGIKNWLEVKHMTLAQLTVDIGLSLVQIGQIQKITASDENGSAKSTATTLTKNDKRDDDDEEDWDNDEVHHASDENGSSKSTATTLTNNVKRDDDDEEDWDNDEVHQANSDVDMVQLMPIESKAVCCKMDSELSEECKLNQVDEVGKLHTISKENANFNAKPIRAETKSNSDWILDDDVVLVIDETGHESIACTIDEDVMPTETSQPIRPTDIWTNIDKPSLRTPTKDANSGNNKDDPTIGSDGHLDGINYDKSYKSENSHPIIIEESKTIKLKEHEHAFTASPNSDSLLIEIPTLSKYDLRLPFADVIVNHAAAFEIDASLKPHRKIRYKLIEIMLPETFEFAIRPEKIPSNTADPRLKKLLYIHNNKSQLPPLAVDQNSEQFMLPMKCFKSQLQLADRIIDPRNRNEPNMNATAKPIQQNFNYVLNHRLQKSMWYLNQSSTAKMEINKHVSKLVGELNKFSLNMSRNRHFQISFMPNAVEIQNVLREIGLQVNVDGVIQERGIPPLGLPHSQAINWSQNVAPVAMFQYPPENNTMVANFCLNQNYGFPKPGLLGIAPGIEMPPSGPYGQNNTNNFFTGPSWNGYTSGYAMSENSDAFSNGSCNRMAFQQMCNHRNGGKNKKKKPRRK